MSKPLYLEPCVDQDPARVCGEPRVGEIQGVGRGVRVAGVALGGVDAVVLWGRGRGVDASRIVVRLRGADVPFAVMCGVVARGLQRRGDGRGGGRDVVAAAFPFVGRMATNDQVDSYLSGARAEGRGSGVVGWWDKRVEGSELGRKGRNGKGRNSLPQPVWRGAYPTTAIALLCTAHQLVRRRPARHPRGPGRAALCPERVKVHIQRAFLRHFLGSRGGGHIQPVVQTLTCAPERSHTRSGDAHRGSKHACTLC